MLTHYGILAVRHWICLLHDAVMRALPRKSNFRIVLHKLTVLCHHEIVPSEQEHGLKVSPFNEQFNVHEKLLDKLLETKYMQGLRG